VLTKDEFIDRFVPAWLAARSVAELVANANYAMDEAEAAWKEYQRAVEYRELMAKVDADRNKIRGELP
jgi:hypothetical protein